MHFRMLDSISLPPLNVFRGSQTPALEAGSQEPAATAQPESPEAMALQHKLLEACASVTPGSVELGAIWRDLVAARLRVAAAFVTKDAGVLALVPGKVGPDQRRHLRAKKLQVLERVLTKGGQKSVAAELGLAPSTVAIIAGNCLRAMGVDTGASRAPLGLVVAAHACFELTALTQGALRRVQVDGVDYIVVSCARPEQDLKELLSPAECAVAKLLIEGLSHAQISLIRHTSTRTIANQLAAAFAKLGVSGRAELLCRLLRRVGQSSSTAPPADSLLDVPLARAVGQ